MSQLSSCGRARYRIDCPSIASADVDAQLTLHTEGHADVEIYPAAAKLAAVTSFAGIGISWSLALIPHERDTPVPLLELRRWYGPPGNPPSPAYAKKASGVGSAGAQHVEHLAACWIPNAQLAPEHLSPAVLDPQG